MRIGTFPASRRTVAASAVRQILAVGAINGGARSFVQFVPRIAHVARIGRGTGFATVGTFFGNAFFPTQIVSRRAAETAVRVASRAMFNRARAAFARCVVFECAAFADAQNAGAPFGIKEIAFFALQTAVTVCTLFAIGQAGNAEIAFQIGARLTGDRFALRSDGLKADVASQTAVGRSALRTARGTRQTIVAA